MVVIEPVKTPVLTPVSVNVTLRVVVVLTFSTTTVIVSDVPVTRFASASVTFRYRTPSSLTVLTAVE